MINRWYIMTTAKSRGYFTGWKYKYFPRSSTRTIVDPSFTNIKSLAVSYTTKKEALEKIKEIKQNILDDIKRINTSSSTDSFKLQLQLLNDRIEFVNKKLIVCKEPIEFKYNITNCAKTFWEVRKAETMSYIPCDVCGYAVHNIPEFIIQFNRRGTVRICAICMSKIADETKIQKAKIPKSIIQHYKEEQFLNLV